MKILMLADSLGVGGVETHIEMLALKLREFGHQIVIASFGGEVANHLKEKGIKHLKLPPANRIDEHFIYIKRKFGSKFAKVMQTLVTKRLICTYLDQELPDIVHAHTRRTAFLVNSPCKVRKIPLITTAHAKFSMDFPKNLLSRWGNTTICVSEDIKKHLVSHSQIAKHNTRVIFNGVDASGGQKYCTGTSHKIIFVSRLDHDCSLGAYLLCKIAPKLVKIYPDLSIKIVGGGSEIAKISQIANEINTKYNRGLINVVGSLENPLSSCAGNELLIGVSRVALEGMAIGLPVILLGNEGYLGLLNEKNLPKAMQTNFTCRGFGAEGVEKISSKSSQKQLERALFEEITHYFELSSEEKRAISSFSQLVVAKFYSSSKMARKTVAVYKENLKRRQRMAICGYYGHGNLGDEAVLSVILNTIDKSRYEVKVIRGKNPWKIIKTLLHTDVFVFGGGSLLQNSTSNRSLCYYLVIIFVAQILCRKTIMLANGIGPIKNSLFSRKFWLKITGAIAKNFDILSVRDRNSRLLLKKITRRNDIALIPDPVLSIFTKVDATSGTKVAPAKEKIVFIPNFRELKRFNIELDEVASALESLVADPDGQLIVAVLHKNEDLDVAKYISKRTGARVVVAKDLNKLARALVGARLVISQRFHGVIFALKVGLPVLSVSNDPKIHSFCQENGVFPAVLPSIFAGKHENNEKITSNDAVGHGVSVKEEPVGIDAQASHQKGDAKIERTPGAEARTSGDAQNELDNGENPTNTNQDCERFGLSDAVRGAIWHYGQHKWDIRRELVRQGERAKQLLPKIMG